MELMGLTEYGDDSSINNEKLAQMQNNFEYYTKLAAEQGDADSQFNLAKNYLMKVDISEGTLNEDDLTNLENAKHWYEQANSNGHEDTEEIISTLNDLLSNSSSDGEGLTEWFENNNIRAKYKPESIEKWSDLEKLDLRTNDLSELPDCISTLTGLVDLSLFHNNFSIVPEIIFNLTELTWLNLGVNRISELPRGIGQLKKLKILDLGQNQLVSLPSEIGELTNLEQLIVHNNNLTSIPKEIGNMTALKHISIWDNDLSSLPDEIMNLNSLETIELQNNNFTDENVKKWTDRFSNTKCKISFGYQQGNISEPIYVETNIKGGNPEDSFLEMYLNSQDGDIVSNIFQWSSSGADESDFLSMYLANEKYSKISISKGLNAIRSENIIVPIHMKINAETPSAEDELIKWVKITYIETCNEHNLKPNPKLHIMSVGSSGSEKTLEMIER